MAMFLLLIGNNINRRMDVPWVLLLPLFKAIFFMEYFESELLCNIIPCNTLCLGMLMPFGLCVI